MKHPSLCLIIPTLLLSSVGATLAQEHKWRPLLPVDTSEVWHSIPGVVPEHGMTYDPVVGDIIRETNLDSLVSYVHVLSGEDSVVVGGARRLIRNRSTQEGSDLAADYLKEKLESFNLEVLDQQYSSTGRNIYATQSGYLYPEQQYIICAHYDAVADYCADDNASGAAGVLEAARILSQYDFKYTVVYALWDEEEGGLIGSNYFASQAASTGMQVQGVINLDMLGWDGNGDKLADIHTQNTANSNDLANLMVIVNYLYQLSLKPVIYNPGTWQSDHSVFWNRGWGAVLLIEAYYGGDLNPYYHGSDDRVSRFSLPYFHDMSRLSLGAMSTLAEVTTDTLLALVTPDYGYQTYVTMVRIRGANTHFQESSGTLTVWLSNGAATIPADSVSVSNDRTLNAWFNLTADVALGLWDVHVQNSIDGILTRGVGFAVLPPPALITISPESLSISVDKGTVGKYPMTIRNGGGSALTYTISNYPRGGGLVAYYPFDGDANDESGKGHDGALVGNVTFEPGRLGDGAHFYDRTTYVEIDTQALNFNGWPELTISAWVKMQEYTTYGTVFSQGMPGMTHDGTELRVGGSWGYWIQGSLSVTLNDSTPEAVVPATFAENAQPMPSLGVWYHVAGTYDGQFLRYYVNGALDGEMPVSAGHRDGPIWSAANAQSRIGMAAIHTDWYDMHLNGLIDEVRIYSRALTEGEVSQLSLGSPIFSGWLIAEPDTGTIEAGSSTGITLTIDATELDAGEYTATLTIRCNDPFTSVTKLPIGIVVNPATGIEQDVVFPKEFSLHQNYPNPFNPSTTIRYGLPTRSRVTLTVFNALGQQVATIVQGEREAGYHDAVFDANYLASGVYVYKLQAGEFVHSKKLVLVK